MLISLHYTRDILIQPVFPFILNKGQPVLHRENEMQMNLCVRIWHDRL